MVFSPPSFFLSTFPHGARKEGPSGVLLPLSLPPLLLPFFPPLSHVREEEERAKSLKLGLLFFSTWKEGGKGRE